MRATRVVQGVKYANNFLYCTFAYNNSAELVRGVGSSYGNKTVLTCEFGKLKTIKIAYNSVYGGYKKWTETNFGDS